MALSNIGRRTNFPDPDPALDAEAPLHAQPDSRMRRNLRPLIPRNHAEKYIPPARAPDRVLLDLRLPHAFLHRVECGRRRRRRRWQ